MKFNKKVISIIVLASTIVFSAAQAGNRDGGHRHDGKRGNPVERMTKKLDLTPAQQDAITAIFNDFKANNERPDREAMKAKHSEMKERFAALMASPTFDEAAMNQHLQERTAKHNEHKLSRLRLQHAIYQQLTPEQQPKYLKMMAKKMRKMKGKRMGHNKQREHKHEKSNHQD